jgi:hypothetical protein
MVNYIYNNPNKSSIIDIKRRCDEVLGNKNYNIFLNNCEHIVTYCITGEKKSDQVRKVVKDLILKGGEYLLNYYK